MKIHNTLDFFRNIVYNKNESENRMVKDVMLHHAIELVLPFIISILEIMGIFVVIWTAIHEFWEYIQNSFMNKNLL